MYIILIKYNYKVVIIRENKMLNKPYKRINFCLEWDHLGTWEIKKKII